jgi:hypothetical protein
MNGESGNKLALSGLRLAFKDADVNFLTNGQSYLAATDPSLRDIGAEEYLIKGNDGSFNRAVDITTIEVYLQDLNTEGLSVPAPTTIEGRTILVVPGDCIHWRSINPTNESKTMDDVYSRLKENVRRFLEVNTSSYDLGVLLTFSPSEQKVYILAK